MLLIAYYINITKGLTQTPSKFQHSNTTNPSQQTHTIGKHIYMRKRTPTHNNYCFEEPGDGFPFTKSATMFTKTLPRFWGTFPKEGAGWSFPCQGFSLAPLGFSLISTTSRVSFFLTIERGILETDRCASISVMFYLFIAIGFNLLPYFNLFIYF